MLSKKTIFHIQSLKQKKFRDQFGEFIAEGSKLVSELIQSSLVVKKIFVINDSESEKFIDIIPSNIEISVLSKSEMERISHMNSASDIVAIVEIPDVSFSINDILEKLVIVLDNIQDPGNLGSIIRTANWFGIQNIICSENTVDLYNPKVVQATMGAITRVHLFYTDIQSFLNSYRKLSDNFIYGTFLSGTNIYQHSLSTKGLIVMGNEGKGISSEIESIINQRLYIPSFFKDISGSESLNVSVAMAIVCSEFSRRI